VNSATPLLASASSAQHQQQVFHNNDADERRSDVTFVCLTTAGTRSDTSASAQLKTFALNYSRTRVGKQGHLDHCFSMDRNDVRFFYDNFGRQIVFSSAIICFVLLSIFKQQLLISYMAVEFSKP